jgi:hypothetical protein
MRSFILVFAVLFSAPALAQNSDAQLYRSITSALAQDNMRLGAQVEQLQKANAVLQKQFDDATKSADKNKK